MKAVKNEASSLRANINSKTSELEKTLSELNNEKVKNQ